MRISIIDTETASLQGPVIEVGKIDINEYGNTLSTLECLVNPQTDIDIEAMVVHNITNEMVSEAPTFADIKGKVDNSDIYIAHNAQFDKRMLGFEDKQWICTLDLARTIFPNEKKHSNMYLFYSLGLYKDFTFEGTAHRALYDCHVTLALLKRMLQVTGKTIPELVLYKNELVGDKICQYKKYKGFAWKDILVIDKNYCRWCVENSLKKGTEQAVREWLVKMLG